MLRILQDGDLRRLDHVPKLGNMAVDQLGDVGEVVAVQDLVPVEIDVVLRRLKLQAHRLQLLFGGCRLPRRLGDPLFRVPPAGLHAVAEVVLDVDLRVLQAPVQRRPDVAAGAQGGDDGLDLLQGLPLLGFGGGDVPSDQGDGVNVPDVLALVPGPELLAGVLFVDGRDGVLSVDARGDDLVIVHVCALLFDLSC